VSRDPYPLQWPEGWPRTEPGRRGTPRFGASFARDRDGVIHQLRKRGSQIVITSNLPLRHDRLPYANASDGGEPGVAVWWVEKGRERVLACDRWRTAALNLRAIDLTLEALRGLERWGASEVVERAFAGFAALPPGAPPAPVHRSWREVLGMVEMQHLAPEDQLAIAKARHRRLIREAHPDLGGDGVDAAALNAALAEAERELGS
jgi:hypothetical protein